MSHDCVLPLVGVTPLRFTPNFSLWVCGAKNHFLANLLWIPHKATKQHKEAKSNYGNPFPTCVIQSTTTKLQNYLKCLNTYKTHRGSRGWGLAIVDNIIKSSYFQSFWINPSIYSLKLFRLFTIHIYINNLNKFHLFNYFFK